MSRTLNQKTTSYETPNQAINWNWALAYFVAVFAGLNWPYWLFLDNPLVNDDWIHLYWSRSVSAIEAFGPRTLWFYRPLHTLMFMIIDSLAGLTPVIWNLSSRTLFLLGAGLWYALLVRLFAQPSIALLATAIFLANWQVYDAINWVSCLGTLMSWTATVVMLHSVLSYARRRSRAALTLAGVATIIALLSKETAVNIPLLAALVVWFGARGIEPLRERARVLIRALAPVVAVLALYGFFYAVWVEDVEWVSAKGYLLVPLTVAIRQLLLATNHTLFFFAPSPWLPAINDSILRFASVGWLPLGILAVAVWRRHRGVLFSLGFAAAASFPQVFSEAFHASRFYLMPAGGTALLWALVLRGFWPGGHLASRERALAWLKVGAVVILLGVALARSQAQLLAVLRHDRADRDYLAGFARYLAQHRSDYPQNACFIFDKIPPRVTEGFGLREMVKIVLGSEHAEAIRNGARLDSTYVKLLNNPDVKKFLIWRDPGGAIQVQSMGRGPIGRLG